MVPISNKIKAPGGFLLLGLKRFRVEFSIETDLGMQVLTNRENMSHLFSNQEIFFFLIFIAKPILAELYCIKKKAAM